MKKPVAILVVFFLVIAIQVISAQHPSMSLNPFSETSISLPGVMSGRAVWGDYDNDGDLDILLIGDTSSTGNEYVSKIFRNDIGNFVNINASLVGVAIGSAAAWGDYDNDGDLDVVLGGATGPNGLNPITKIYRNDGGVFVDLNAGLPATIGGSVDWGDYDNDGDLDLLITGAQTWNGNFLSRIYRNDGGSFVNINANLPGVWGSSVRWGDYDNDGDLDITLTGFGGTAISTLFRNDEQNFVNVSAPFDPANSGTVAWGDYDNDGDLDLLFSGELAGGDSVSNTTLYRNDSGTFENVYPSFVPLICSVAWGDYDNDGDLDVVTAGAGIYGGFDLRSIVYRNDGGVFVVVDSLTGIWGGSVAWGDYDNDGDLDILLTGATRNTNPYNPVTKIYRNNLGSNTFGQNTPPTIPPAPMATVTGNSVTLSWNKSTDAQTPQDGLTYNIRVGTTPGGAEVVPPMSIASTGVRTVVQLGNTNHRNAWTLRNLLAGTYYWSVQAIDGAFAGSAFAAEQSFSVSAGQRAPHLVSVRDVPNDQGGRVTARWQASSLDTNVSLLPSYSIWRALPESSTVSNAKLGSQKEGLSSSYRYFMVNGIEYSWEWIANVPAHKFPTYSYTAPTLYDSMSSTDGKHYFLVSAQTGDPNIFYDSNVDSGYSVDNLPPHGPLNFRFSSGEQQTSVIFQWGHPGDADVFQFRLYRSQTPNFDPEAIEPYATVSDTEYHDPSPRDGWWYAARAVDIHGNVGPKSNEVLLLIGDIKIRPGIPTEFALEQNYPNPFNPYTTIDFDLPTDGFVVLKVYNTLGQITRALINRPLIAGRYSISIDGTGLLSGVYLYQLSSVHPETGTVLFERARKFILLK